MQMTRLAENTKSDWGLCDAAVMEEMIISWQSYWACSRKDLRSVDAA